MSVDRRRAMIEPEHPHLSIVRQCELVSISRSGFYRAPAPETAVNLALMRLIDEQFLETPWYGSRQMARHLRRLRPRGRPQAGAAADGADGAGADLPAAADHGSASRAPDLSVSAARSVVDRPNQVWCADITYIPMRRGFLYLVAVMDWSTRQVLCWRLSNTMDVEFCIAALEEALARFGAPGDLQHRPGQPVHLAAVHRRADRTLACASRWTAAAAGWTTCSSSGCGAA